MKHQKIQKFFFSCLLMITCCITLSSTSFSAQQPATVEEAQEFVNMNGGTWKAGRTSMFGVPAAQLCGSELHPDAKSAKRPADLLSNQQSGAAAAFDWRNHNGHDWTTPIKDQGGCGSCFIFGTHAAAEAAMKVQSGTYGYMADPDLSEQYTFVCPGLGSCDGGYSGDALDFLQSSGSPDDGCFPYTASDATSCSNACSNSADRLHWIDNWDHPGGYPNWYPTVAQIKTAIETYGPVSTYMEVYTDFRDYYTSGVYTHSFGTDLGGHTVTIVGWDDALQCWIVKNSWGTGWGENGWFRIKYGEVDIERQTEFVQAGLANLTDHTPSGWTHSLVPRTANDTTTSYCPLPATLPGNSDSIYLNSSSINNGSETAPPFLNRFYIDDVYVRWMTYGKIGANGGFYAPNQGTFTIKGGRHYIGHYYDYNEEVWEKDENVYTNTFDNYDVRPYIFSPLSLIANAPISRNTPPKKDPHGYSWYSNDGFSFHVESSPPDNWWSVVSVLPANAAADYDIRLWDIGDYTGSETGFGSGSLEQSSSLEGLSDFVIVNDNMAAAGTYYAGVINYNNSSGDFGIEHDSSEKIYAGKNGPYSKSSNNIIDIYEYYIYAYSAADYGFKLEQTSGTCNLGMSLYDNETITASKNEYMTGGYADAAGDGGDEYMRVTIPNTGNHGLAIWKVEASDYNKSCTYQIKVGLCATPGALSSPSPADNATKVPVDTDLDWADSANTEYYDVWLKEGSGAWIKQGTTETSEWPLPTLNELTTYQWYVQAHNICGNLGDVYWSFTTEDNTPPTPNPMDFAVNPHETGLTSIAMTAKTATDPTGPVQYYLDTLGSPTGGTGASDSGWQAGSPYTDGGLQANHQYGYRVFARDGSGNITNPSVVRYDYTTIEASTGITFGSYGITYIQARSTNTPSGLTRGSSGLAIFNITSGNNSGWKQNNNYWQSSGLTPNTDYGFRAQARNGDSTTTALCPVAYRRTLANPPAAAIFTNITQSSIQANWTTNSNPSGTEYYCENITAGTNSGWITVKSWNSTGLNGNTSYFFQVKSRNGDSIETVWTNLGSKKTLPLSDLVVTGIVTDPVHPEPGDTVTVEVTVENQGSGVATGNFYTVFYKDLTTPPPLGTTGDLEWPLSGLAAGSSYTFSDDVIYDDQGTFSMYAQVDNYNTIVEDSESNNIFGPQDIHVGVGETGFLPAMYMLLLDN